MKVGFIQQANSHDSKDNLEHALAQIELAQQQGADLVVLQELHNHRYFCQQENEQYFALAEAIDGPTQSILSAAAKHHNIVIVGSIYEQRHVGLYHNTALVIDSDGSLAGFYRKMHIPDDPGYYEKYYFTPGDNEFLPIKTSIGNLGVCVCWDQWFPESARLMALAGADMLIFPSAIGWDPEDTDSEKQRQLDAWITIQRSHAIANNLPVISVNRVGHEIDESNITQGIEFWGNSFICDGMGKILTQADSQNNAMRVININLEETQQLRNVWPFFRDRRIDAYTHLSKRWRDKQDN
jgi:N-carbamoylputrescine amidase